MIYYGPVGADNVRGGNARRTGKAVVGDGRTDASETKIAISPVFYCSFTTGRAVSVRRFVSYTLYIIAIAATTKKLNDLFFLYDS